MDKKVTGAARVFTAVFLFPGRFPILKDNGLKAFFSGSWKMFFASCSNLFVWWRIANTDGFVVPILPNQPGIG